MILLVMTSHFLVVTHLLLLKSMVILGLLSKLECNPLFVSSCAHFRSVNETMFLLSAIKFKKNKHLQ